MKPDCPNRPSREKPLAWLIAAIPAALAATIISNSAPEANSYHQYDSFNCPAAKPQSIAACLSGKDGHRSLFEIGKDVDAIVFGEAHANSAQKLELASRMKELYAAGYRLIGLEAMPSSRQYLLEQYRAGTLPRAELAEKIKTSWGYNPEPYLVLIDSAMAAKIQVVFLDADRERLDITSPGWEEREAQMERRREAHWIEVISAYQEEMSDGGKSLFLIGDLHVRLVALKLGREGAVVATVTLTGGEFFYDDVYAATARSLHLFAATRLILTTDLNAPAGPGYILLLPQPPDASIIGKVKVTAD